MNEVLSDRQQTILSDLGPEDVLLVEDFVDLPCCFIWRRRASDGMTVKLFMAGPDKYELLMQEVRGLQSAGHLSLASIRHPLRHSSHEWLYVKAI